MSKITLVTLTLIALFVSLSAYGKTVYVDEADGDDTNDGLSWLTAKATIQKGIDEASDGDTVLVKYGTYSITNSIDFGGKNIKLASDDGTHLSYENAATDASQCIIDAGENCQVFYFHLSETSEAVVNGFTIKNGRGRGGGVYCYYSSPTITNNTITNNSAKYYNGGGIYCYSSSPTITNNTITGNAAYKGGGIYCYSSSSPVITNTIIWGNSPSDIYPDDLSNVSYSDIGGGYTGEGNIDTVPLFVDAVGGDYNLSNCSQCIGAGTLDGAPSEDIEGNPRPNPPQSNPDIGAYEDSLGAPDDEVCVPKTLYVSTVGNDSNDGLSWQSAKATIQEAINAALDTDTVLVGYGTYNITNAIDFGGKNIKLASDDGTHLSYENAATDASQCIIDAEKNCRVFYFHLYETSEAVVNGFTIKNGMGEYGGGIYCISSSPTITNNTITENAADNNGGGIS